MAAQHKEVMEERELNGLRMPSPAPATGEGRIAAVAKSQWAPVSEKQPSSLSPLAPAFELSSRSPEHRGRSLERDNFRSDKATQTKKRKGVSLNGGRPSVANLRKERDDLPPTSYLPQIHDIHTPLVTDTIPDNACDQEGIIGSDSTGCDLQEPINESGWQPEEDESHQAHLNLPQSHDPSRFLEVLLDDDDDVDVDEEDDQESALTPRPTCEDKGKGRELDRSPSPVPQSRPIPRGPSYSNRQGIKPIHRSPAFHLEEDAVYDPDTGESIVYIPWSYRDPEEDRINDSKVTEIHLGETSDDGCEIREVFAKMSMQDLDFETVMANRRSAEGEVVDLSRAQGCGFDMGSDWRENLKKNEGVLLGAVWRKGEVLAGRW